MASNDWINGYLEAVLDAEGTKKDATWRKSPMSPTKYFVEEVVARSDDTDLLRTWVKVNATRDSCEKNVRLENMCWRVWHLAREKKQPFEREQGRKDASEDLSELSEGEKERGDFISSELHKDEMMRNNSELKFWADEDKSKRLYIVLISLHGLVRGHNMELGRDSDTGGQVKIVVELARALAKTKGVYRVDLLTRQISSPDVDSSYGEPIERLSSPSDTDGQVEGESCGAYIIRLPCGPCDRYIPKESLWPHIPEFVDEALGHIVNMARVIGDEVDEEGKPIWPCVIHGHYADAGEVAAYLAGSLNVPMVLTAQSLGRNKIEQLMQQGRLSMEEINSTYRIMRRVEAEEFGLDAAEMVISGTRQEIEEQWGLYDGFDIKLERKLTARRRRGVSCLGRNMPQMVVIPPGIDFSYVKAQEDADGGLSSLIGSDATQNKKNLPPIWSEIMRFFTNPHKPMILALSRPDPKKNVATLLKAFGECKQLRELANLTLILGNRDDIKEMPNTPSAVLMTVLWLIDKYDLYGQVAYPKHHKQFDVPELYRLAAKTKGVFVNPALIEPFGLTLIEASANGLPTVSTKNGGPVDIQKALNSCLLVDPHDQKAISDALLKLVSDKALWNECRKNGLENIHRFSWQEHCRNYLSHIEQCRDRHSAARLQIVHQKNREPLSDVEDLSFSIDGETKVDGELEPTSREKELINAPTRPQHAISSNTTGGAKSYLPGKRQRLIVIAVDCYKANGSVNTAAFSMIMREALAAASDPAGKTGFLISTGSSLTEVVEALRSCQLEPSDFDALICSSGSEMYYPWRDLIADDDYLAHVRYRWPGDNVRSMVARLAKLDGGDDDAIAEYPEACNSCCNAYMVKPGTKVSEVDELRRQLRMQAFRCNFVYTQAATRLNVVPLFASRAQALRYLSVRWGIELSKMVVFVGEKGDTDYEELLGGIRKTLILHGSVENGSEALLRASDSVLREDIVPQDSPNIVSVKEGFGAKDIKLALEKSWGIVFSN